MVSQLVAALERPPDPGRGLCPETSGSAARTKGYQTTRPVLLDRFGIMGVSIQMAVVAGDGLRTCGPRATRRDAWSAAQANGHLDLTLTLTMPRNRFCRNRLSEPAEDSYDVVTPLKASSCKRIPSSTFVLKQHANGDVSPLHAEKLPTVQIARQVMDHMRVADVLVLHEQELLGIPSQDGRHVGSKRLLQSPTATRPGAPALSQSVTGRTARSSTRPAGGSGRVERVRLQDFARRTVSPVRR